MPRMSCHGKILIFSRFLAHSITCLLLKNVVLGHFWPFWGLVFLEFLRWGRVDQFSILWFVSIIHIICQLFEPFIQKRVRQNPPKNEKMWFSLLKGHLLEFLQAFARICKNFMQNNYNLNILHSSVVKLSNRTKFFK